ncbi:MAG: glycoside hydrolase family 16 protein [Gemmatimonadaceae bacterium]|nr:glycoside hydrolase family 16 protein [Gemmatimonadaceae bacterium]
MRHRALVVGLVALGAACGGAPREPATGVAPAGWRLTWSDEFTGPVGAPPDPRVWVADTGDGCSRGICGWGNQERQRYTVTRENAALTGTGMLAITARVAPEGQRCWYGTCRYTSAKFITKGRVEPRHGRVAIRAKVPSGQGIWPAFWMLGAGWPEAAWPQVGELDIMEIGSSRPWINAASVHGPGYSGQTPFTHRDTADRSRAGEFRVYAVERDSTQLRFFVDDVPHYVVTRAEIERKGAWVFDGPMFLLLNLAVGGIFDGDPASDAVLPATMLVDWVRVWERVR